MIAQAGVYSPPNQLSRWSSGNPRMLVLIALVLEIEPRRVVRFRIYLQKKNKDQLLRAPSVGRHNSTRVDEGSKS